MASISRLFMRQLNHDELDTVFGRIINFMETYFEKKADEIGADFIEAAKTFHIAVRRSLISPDGLLEEADAAADKAWYLLYWQFKISLDHPTENIREAAKVVFETFSKIPNPTQLPYEEEYQEIKNLLDQLEALPTVLLDQALVTYWVHYLRTCYNNFISASETVESMRVIEAAGSIKQCRVKACDAYQDFIQRIKALNELHPDANLTAFIDQHNSIVDISNQNAFSRMNDWERLDSECPANVIAPLETAQ